MESLELYKRLEWQNFYYGKIRSWLPLSMIPYIKENMHDLSFMLDKTDSDLLKAIVDNVVEQELHFKEQGIYHKFCLAVITYMFEKNVHFEIALKRTRNLKAYQQVIYRKSDITTVVVRGILEYRAALKERQKVVEIYQSERNKQIKELHGAMKKIQSGSEEIVISKELLATLMYRQILGYHSEYDTLNTDNPMMQELTEMESFIEANEKSVWE